MNLRRPDGPGRWALASAVAAWTGTVAGRSGWWLVPVVGAAIAAIHGRRRIALLLAAVLAAGFVSGRGSAGRETATFQTPIPEGRIAVAGRALDDPRTPQRGARYVRLAPSHRRDESHWSPWRGPPLLVPLTDEVEVTAGDVLIVEGALADVDGRARGDPYGAVFRNPDVERVGGPGPFLAAANRLRSRVLLRFQDDGRAGALVTGFLIGEVGALPRDDLEAMRRAGLSHFVAVSGSNVALFLGLLWLTAGSFGVGPGRRALLGTLGLALFVSMTRWEPSVLRASVVAWLALTAVAGGIPLSGWSALGAAVTVLVVVSGELVEDVGFQLSVAAALGLLVTGGRGRPRWLAILTATAAAQAAVAPLLVVHFGSVPVAAPLANLLAAPLVVLSTITGGLGALLSVEPLADVGTATAGLVLLVAGWIAPLPQIGWAGLLLLFLVAVPAIALPRSRPLAAAGVALAVAVHLLVPAGPPSGPTVIFLDVGQGDAALLWGPGGEAILVDGGPDPARVVAALRRRGIRRISLILVSHPHEDHVAGLIGVLSEFPVDVLWRSPGSVEPGSTFDELLHVAAERKVRVEAPAVGRRARVGVFELEVLGPRRRYESLNDQSLVVLAGAAGRRVLLAGDIEVVAQRELGVVGADVLKVPHQGAGTSDPAWLAANAGELAVVSVGPNDFGHPSPWVLETLQEAGAVVRRTDLQGDIEIDLRTVPSAGGLSSVAG